jgi:hypothetical protein
MIPAMTRWRFHAVVATAWALVGADQFVYFDAANPKRCLAPDAFITLGVPDHDFDAYLAWEEGTPDVALRVTSQRNPNVSAPMMSVITIVSQCTVQKPPPSRMGLARNVR